MTPALFCCTVAVDDCKISHNKILCAVYFCRKVSRACGFGLFREPLRDCRCGVLLRRTDRRQIGRGSRNNDRRGGPCCRQSPKPAPLPRRGSPAGIWHTPTPTRAKKGARAFERHPLSISHPLESSPQICEKLRNGEWQEDDHTRPSTVLTETSKSTWAEGASSGGTVKRQRTDKREAGHAR